MAASDSNLQEGCSEWSCLCCLDIADSAAHELLTMACEVLLALGACNNALILTLHLPQQHLAVHIKVL